MVLGVVVAALLARGPGTLPAALAGVLLADLAVRGIGTQAAVSGAAVLGLQALLAGGVMRATRDPQWLLLDTWPRLKRLVLVAAPAAAGLGVVGGLLGLLVHDGDPAQATLRPQLAAAVGRFIADAAGIIVTAPVLLCWLARPVGPWRARRRLVALPLLLLVEVMLPGLDELATPRRAARAGAVRPRSRAAARSGAAAAGHGRWTRCSPCVARWLPPTAAPTRTCSTSWPSAGWAASPACVPRAGWN